jgi:hypothetical protein
VSVLWVYKFAKDNYDCGSYVSENSEQLLCRLEDGVFCSFRLTKIMFHGDPLTNRTAEIIGLVFEAGLHNYWISPCMNMCNFFFQKIAIVHPPNGYYSFIVYHVQPAFSFLLMVWCLSALCFKFELLYNRMLSKIK